MSESCSGNCASCGESCGDRSQESLLAPANPKSNVKKVIAVMSGKGGVGKSTVSAMLAVAMMRKGYRTAILDADITGPSIPKAFGVTDPMGSTEDALYPARSEDGIEIYGVKSGTYTGYMMVVLDPARVTVGTCRDKFNGQKGLQLKDIAKRYDALAAINGGGFEDEGGVGNGGTPVGLVISEGKLMHTGKDRNYNITVGFDQNNIMVISKMSANDAKKKGIRDAMTFGPRLIVNGEPANVKGQSSGLNPRTAIGQRADGAVLMLVIDGRQASSLGATYSDLIKVMLEYGAINAINLDGGSSSLIYYRGEYLNNGVVLTGSREMPTAFIVR